MAKIETLILLVRALSKPEKRYFKLHSQLQQGDKSYLVLFHILENTTITMEHMREVFQRQTQNASFEMAGKYLYKALMKALSSFEAEKNVDTRLMAYVQECKILFRKGIYEACFKQLRKGQQLALDYEKYFYFLILARMELEYLTRREFQGIEEASLIKKQLKIDEILSHEQSINNHSSLYELLLFRLTTQGPARSQAEKDRLNDLVFSELQIMANPHYNSFSASKVHLLFQSVYFMMIGDHKSSLGNYYALNNLFEKNKALWATPPVYYIYNLQGILSNLRTIQKYHEMEFFLRKLETLVPDSQSFKILLFTIIYRFRVLLNADQGNFEAALEVVKTYEAEWQKNINLLSPNVKAEYCLYTSLVYLGLKQYEKANHYLNEVLNMDKAFRGSHHYKICRLISLIVHAEMKNYDYLTYEIRSFERQLSKGEKPYNTEKIIFRIIKTIIQYSDTRQKSKLLKYKEALDQLLSDNYESQLLKTFDFSAWVASKINRSR